MYSAFTEKQGVFKNENLFYLTYGLYSVFINYYVYDNMAYSTIYRSKSIVSKSIIVVNL